MNIGKMRVTASTPVLHVGRGKTWLYTATVLVILCQLPSSVAFPDLSLPSLRCLSQRLAAEGSGERHTDEAATIVRHLHS